MTCYLRVNHFIDSANQAYASHQNFLVAEPQGLGVSIQNLPATFSPEAVDLNKRTWKIFRESLVGTIGQDKFNWICTRYGSKINFTKLEQKGAPLLPEHVELFSIGSSQLRVRDIKEKLIREIRNLTPDQRADRANRTLTPEQRADLRDRNPEPELLADKEMRNLTRRQLEERMRQVQPFPVVGEYIDPIKIYGTPKNLSAWFVHNKVLMDKEKQLLFSDIGNITSQAWLERMTKAVSCRELLEGQLIPAPGIPLPGQDSFVDYYEVYSKVATGHGLVAYALKPVATDSRLKPLIIFRPSQFAPSNEDAIETFLNDVQARVGELGWTASVHAFEALMNDPNFRRINENEMVETAGYSLGGAHQQYFVETHHANVSRATFYSDPSVDDDIAERFAATVNQTLRRREPLNIEIFRMKGDPAHSVGGKHIGWGVTHPDVHIQLTQTKHENNAIGMSYLHAHRIFDHRDFQHTMQIYENPQLFCLHNPQRNENIRVLPDDLLDNSKLSPIKFWYERKRRLWGQVAYYSFRTLAMMINFVSWTLGIKILRSSRDSELT